VKSFVVAACRPNERIVKQHSFLCQHCGG